LLSSDTGAGNVSQFRNKPQQKFNIIYNASISNPEAAAIEAGNLTDAIGILTRANAYGTAADSALHRLIAAAASVRQDDQPELARNIEDAAFDLLAQAYTCGYLTAVAVSRSAS
jgi:hypothetical protein